MPLLEDIKSALERLKRAEAARVGVVEIQALEEQRSTLFDKHTELNKLELRAELFKRNRIALTSPSGHMQVRTKLETVKAQFRANPVVATLKSGRRISTLVGSLDALTDEIEGKQLADWRTFYSSKLFGGAAPDVVKARLAMTPRNADSLGRYDSLFKSFAAFRSRIPESQDELDRVIADSKALGEITFDEKVPEDVAKFFAATASNLGAQLSLLTPQVMKWLRDNQLLEKYVVRANRE